jgi:hypothetical protein
MPWLASVMIRRPSAPISPSTASPGKRAAGGEGAADADDERERQRRDDHRQRHVIHEQEVERVEQFLLQVVRRPHRRGRGGRVACDVLAVDQTMTKQHVLRMLLLGRIGDLRERGPRLVVQPQLRAHAREFAPRCIRLDALLDGAMQRRIAHLRRRIGHRLGNRFDVHAIPQAVTVVEIRHGCRPSAPGT